MPWVAVRRPLPALALALLLVTAGCSFDAGSPATDPDAPTVTPAPLPSTDTPSATATQTPPKLPDPTARAFEHAAALENRSFTLREYREIRFPNGTRYHEHETNTTVAADETRYRLRSVTRSNAASFPSGTREFNAYSNGTFVAYRGRADGRNDTGLFRAPEGDPADPRDIVVRNPVNDDRLLALFALVSNVTVRGNESFEGITATRFAQSSFVVDGVELRNVSLVSFEATVDDGLVREYRLVLVGVLNGERVRAVEQVRYAEVGDAVVTQPAWFDRVVANASDDRPTQELSATASHTD